jgi:leader peptidase (prepilin peptidase)/N-methyltransferase
LWQLWRAMIQLPAHGWLPAGLLAAVLAAATGPAAHRAGHNARSAAMAAPARDQEEAFPATGPLLPSWALTLIGAAAGALIGVRFGWSAQLPAYLVLVAIAAPVTSIDLAAHRIPDRLLASAAAATLLLLVAASAREGTWTPLVRALLAALLLVAGFLLLAIIAGGGLGLADVKVTALMGLWLGYQAWNTIAAGLFAAFCLAALVGLLLVASGRRTRASQLALGPHLLAGTLIALVAARL